MLTAVLIDDEDNALNVLSQLLRDFVNIPVKVLGTAKNLREGIKIINSTKPDVVFLDIDLPEMSGMEIYTYFERPDFKIIFVTAYNQYAIKALKKSASDYILKPINFLELREAVRKVTAEIEQDQYTKKLEDKVNLICTAEMEGQPLMFDVTTGFVMENTKNIEYCHAEKAYSVIVTYTGKKIILSKSLKELQEQLPENQFLRTHKTYLVNIYYIRKFVRAKESYVLLKSGTRIPVSIRNGSFIRQKIEQILAS